MYLQELRGEVSQCDIFDSLPIACAQQQTRDLTALNTRALLLTYDCEYDKPSTERVIAAGIFLLSEVPANQRGNVRKNRVFSTFYLQASPLLEESFVDFRYMGLLEKAIVAEESQAGKRLVSLGDEAQLALQEQLSAFFGYGRNR